MPDQDTIDGLLVGAIDTHIHSAPDVLPRKFNDLELAQRFKARRMAGFVLKSHYICTADRATLVNQIVPEIHAFGAIALNNSVGGLNPLALDIAGRLGNKVVFLPSVDNANELENVSGQRDESKLPYWMSIAREMRALGIAGLHKFLKYSTWFRNPLAPYVTEKIGAAQMTANGFWNGDALVQLARQHLSGAKDFPCEINAALTLESLERQLFRELPRGLEN